MALNLCVQCRKTVDASLLSSNRCPDCLPAYARRLAALGPDRSYQRPVAPPPPQPMIVTTETHIDLPIEERFGIVSAECVLGVSIFRDLAGMVRDAVGGRVVSSQNSLKEARTTALEEMKREAQRMGANAVIAVDLDYSEISGGGKSMLLVAATGTAVRLGEAKPPAPETETRQSQEGEPPTSQSRP